MIASQALVIFHIKDIVAAFLELLLIILFFLHVTPLFCNICVLSIHYIVLITENHFRLKVYV